MESYDGLTLKIAEVLETAAEQGWVLPWHMVVIASNGAMIYSKYDASAAEDDTLDCTMLTEYMPDGGLGLKTPINLVITDGTGEAMQMLIQTPSKN